MKKLQSVVAMLFLTAGMAIGQVTTGTLVGTVKDNSGAVVPNVSVVATDKGTGVTYPGTTNGQGEYRINNLPAGNYDIRATVSGFTASVLKDLAISANRDQTGNLELSAGTTTSVEVTTEAAVSLDTTTSQLGTVFQSKETEDLPTATVGLGVLNLSLLSPGVATTGGIGAGTGPSIGGQRARNNNFEVDGIDNNNKSVTGPFINIPNDAVGEFVVLQNVFGAQYGHSTGGQFNSLVRTGTNTIHGRLYEYFDNRNLNAVDRQQYLANLATAGRAPNFQPRYDFNRYGGQVGGAPIKDRLFLFSNFERQTTGQAGSSSPYCAPTAAGLATLNGLTFASTTNFAVFKNYIPTAAVQAPAGGDAGCSSGNTITVNNAAGAASTIPVGDFAVTSPSYTNFYFSTSSGDYTISNKDSLHVRYAYNREDSNDLAATFAAFYTNTSTRFHLVAINETHVFTTNLSNDFRVGYNRFYNVTPVPAINFPGLSAFPNLVFYDLNTAENLGPDPNAPQQTITNLYQAIDSITWVKGKHTIVLGAEGRKSIAPELFVQRARGDYEYLTLSSYLNDLSPNAIGQRNAVGPIGTPIFYGDQTAFYGFANDDWRVSPNLTLNLGLRYEFTSIPAGEKEQSFNSAASVAGLISFNQPKPQYKNFAPRIGFNYSPDGNTSIRGGFGIGYDVLYDNIGTTEAPPQFQSTLNVASLTNQTANFLAGGGLPGTFSFSTLAQQKAATTAYVPDQKLPYSEQYTLGIQHVFHQDYTAEVRYVGTRGVHLDVQDQINRYSPLTAATQLPTAYGGSTTIGPNGQTKATLSAQSSILPAFAAAGFTSTITSDQSFGASTYNGLQGQLTRRFKRGLLVNAAYTFSKAMDNATADFNTSAINPRRPQDSQNLGAEYSLSALSRKHRLTMEAVYDLPFFKNGNWFMKNLVGNWEITPVYTFQSPQFTTPQSNLDSNLNNDSAPDRTFINPNGVQGTGSGVVPIVNGATVCTSGISSTPNAVINGTTTTVKSCSASIIGYAEGSIVSPSTGVYNFVGSNAYYVQGGSGTIPNGARNTLATGRTNNVDLSAYKRFMIYKDRLGIEFGAQAFNVLNHPQYLPGSLNTVNSISSTGSRAFVIVNGANFNQKQNVFNSNARAMQLSGKITF